MADPKNISPRAWAELLLLAMIWGASFLSIRVALDEIGVATAVAHRVGWAALILWGVVAVRRLPLPRNPRIWGAFLVMGILNNVIPFSMMGWGQLHIETGLTSILNATTAIFGVVVAAAVFADEPLSLRRIIGVSLGFLGVATAIGIEALANFDIQSLAQLAVLCGTFSYALAVAWARKTLGGLPPLVAAAGMLTGSSLIMVPAAWIIDGPITLALQPRTLMAIAYYAAIATALAYLLYYRVLAMAGAGNVMLCTLLIPPVAIVLGVIVLGETLHPSAYVGFAILAAGLLILNGKGRRKTPLSKPQVAR
ncbi:DMT family transporter [Oceaniglobus ichthyenteri]|uniref:DMT family transporter n=1 Tax=Oceaniglobus ichthyenteri TaxID=2136177 RepID=UPI000D34DA23|nr:DMT family transporter [Oceaniglobus ichthyenteri]